MQPKETDGEASGVSAFVESKIVCADSERDDGGGTCERCRVPERGRRTGECQAFRLRGRWLVVEKKITSVNVYATLRLRCHVSKERKDEEDREGEGVRARGRVGETE